MGFTFKELDKIDARVKAADTSVGEEIDEACSLMHLIPKLTAELRKYKRSQENISEALNSGDGTYRP